MAQYRTMIGEIGENAVTDELLRRGWQVENLNRKQTNYPNIDLEIQKGDIKLLVQVKTCTMFAWILAGSVNPKVCAGGPIFNRIEGSPIADFIICITPERQVEKGIIPETWRYFVLPVAVAEVAFRINIDAYYNGVNKAGASRRKSGTCQDFVGPEPFRYNCVPDHHQDFEPYEGRFDLLETFIHV